METKWTSGPWFAKGNFVWALNDNGVNRFDLGINAGWETEAQRTSREEAEANAHLIAAAPDLYETLAEALILIPPHYDTADKARAALAKARGESSDEEPRGES